MIYNLNVIGKKINCLSIISNNNLLILKVKLQKL